MLLVVVAVVTCCCTGMVLRQQERKVSKYKKLELTSTRKCSFATLNSLASDMCVCFGGGLAQCFSQMSIIQAKMAEFVKGLVLNVRIYGLFYSEPR